MTTTLECDGFWFQETESESVVFCGRLYMKSRSSELWRHDAV
jgi:hypothetical protein